MRIHYELDLKSRTAPFLWIRQRDRHDTLDDALASAHQVRRLAKRECRVVRITSCEEVVHEGPHQ